MIYEQLDKNSGAILFKKDRESRKIDIIYDEMLRLQKEVKRLNDEVAKLKSSK